MFIKRKKLMIFVIVLLIICTGIGFGLAKYRDSMLDTRIINEYFNNGGYDVLVNCYGKGEPTVIFEPSLSSMYYWKSVQNEISKITRTFSYNWVNTSNLEKNSLDQVNDLYTLLNNTKVKGPYILVAHSIGGYNARLFASTYPKEVLGIVLVDTSHENQKIPVRFEASASQLKEARKKDVLRNIPIIILTAGKMVTYNELWLGYQKDLASLSDYSEHIIVKDSGHFIQRDNLQVVIDSIKKLIYKVRK